MQREALDFSRRADLTEWMDGDCTYAELRDCLRDLERVNRTVFSYRPTLGWIESAAKRAPAPLRIVDVGCGGGDTLRRIEKWSRESRREVTLTGIDLNANAIAAAKEFTAGDSRIRWICGDATQQAFQEGIDVVISSLVTHHMTNEEIVRFLAWMERVTARGWFINDLARGRGSYYGFVALSRLMRWHKFVQHDGPVSVRRSFVEADWQTHIRRAGLDPRGIQVQRVWPGRLCVSRVK